MRPEVRVFAMILRRAGLAGTCLAAAIAAAAGQAGAQPVRVHVEGEAARAVWGAQERETGWGATGSLGVEMGLVPMLGAQIEIGGVALSAGKIPLDPRLAPRGRPTGQTAMGGVRLRPFASELDDRALSPAGLWLDANLGAAHTGDLVRLAFDAHVGFDFLWSAAAVGPCVGYLQVVEPDDTLRPDDAHLLLLGVHGTLGRTLARPPEPVHDRDADGIPDEVDACPDEPEDKDGFEDRDGCPDFDNDKDSVLDEEDACPLVPGRRTTDPKTNGCPAGDRDHDGINDDEDRCPDEPEDKDGFQDDDGCPDPDNDKDGIADGVDKCPNEPETFNGYADDDGCPDSEQVRVVGDKMLLDERVHFETNRWVVLADSQPLLWRVAQLLIKHPEYVSVEVEGYCDERGTEAFNQMLSENRAKAVRDMLIKYGVSRERLTAIGYGTSNPRVSEKSDKAYRENRRVEFRLTRQTQTTTHTDSAPGSAAPDAGEKQ